MLGDKYTFSESSSCCVCCGPTRPRCPGIFGCIIQTYLMFNISGGGFLDTSSTGLLGLISNPNKMNLVKRVPFFCCNYFDFLSCKHTEILLHNQYKIQSPINCFKTHTISNNDKAIGEISDLGFCCCRFFEIHDYAGQLNQTVTRQDGKWFGTQWVGIDSNGEKVSQFHVSKSFLGGGLEVVVDLPRQNETTKLLSLGLVPYL